MNNGLLYVAFGRKCDELASHTIAYSRQFTDLPICVITNMKDRTSNWDSISNVSFIEVSARDIDNRKYKTAMDKYTPFDETLYLDCDSVIQKKGIEVVFEIMGDADTLLNLFLFWHKTNRVINIYKRAMKKTKTLLPLNIYNGAFICFKKNKRVEEFFLMWNSFWVLTGSGREMPALACAVSKSDIKVMSVNPYVYKLFSPEVYLEKCIVQHNYNPCGRKDFFQRYDIPRIELAKPFDKDGSQSDWGWEDF